MAEVSLIDKIRIFVYRADFILFICSCYYFNNYYKGIHMSLLELKPLNAYVDPITFIDETDMLNMLADTMKVGRADLKECSTTYEELENIKRQFDTTSVYRWANNIIYFMRKLCHRDHEHGEWAVYDNIMSLSTELLYSPEDLSYHRLAEKSHVYQGRYSVFKLLSEVEKNLNLSSQIGKVPSSSTSAYQLFHIHHNLYSDQLDFYKKQVGSLVYDVFTDFYLETFGNDDIEDYLLLLSTYASIVNEDLEPEIYEFSFKTMKDKVLMQERFFTPKEQSKYLFECWCLEFFGKKPGSLKGLVSCRTVGKNSNQTGKFFLNR